MDLSTIIMIIIGIIIIYSIIKGLIKLLIIAVLAFLIFKFGFVSDGSFFKDKDIFKDDTNKNVVVNFFNDFKEKREELAIIDSEKLLNLTETEVKNAANKYLSEEELSKYSKVISGAIKKEIGNNVNEEQVNTILTKKFGSSLNQETIDSLSKLIIVELKK